MSNLENERFVEVCLYKLEELGFDRNLILAAPELLRACKWALAELDSYIRSETHPSGMIDELSKLQALKEAIERAEGKK